MHLEQVKLACGDVGKGLGCAPIFLEAAKFWVSF